MLSNRARKDSIRYVLIALLILYASGRVLEHFPSRAHNLFIVCLDVIPPAIFAVVHGSRIYRLRDIFAFVLLCLGVAAFFESVGLRTGFPYGHYVFTGLMGPDLFGLPILLALAYVGTGYLSWIVALSILKYRNPQLQGSMVLLVPLVAGFVMVAWDLAMDPVWANIDRAWLWKNGGAYFGVPVSNFFGWYLTVYVFYQLFALFLMNRSTVPVRPAYWRTAIAFYAISALGNLLATAPQSMPSFIVDASGRIWTVSSILWAARLISVFVMIPLAIIAWARISSSPNKMAPSSRAASAQ